MAALMHHTTQFRFILKEIGRYPLLMPLKEKELAQRIEKGDDLEAKNLLMRANFVWWFQLLKNMLAAVQILTLLDLDSGRKSWSCIKLLINSIGRKATNSQPMPPGGFAKLLLEHLADQSRTIRVPVHMVETIAKV
jgi:RNA polymerase primary sigma factor